MLQFFIGLMVGGAAGILIMCLLQINRLFEDEDTAEHRKS